MVRDVYFMGSNPTVIALGDSRIKSRIIMMSSNGNIFHTTGPLWGESTGHRCIRLTKASDAEL